MEFIYQCIDYLKANPTLAYVLIGAVAAFLILTIVLIAVGVKRSKAKKRAKNANLKTVATKTAPVVSKTSVSVAAPEKTAQESAEEEKARKEALRQATLARLEAERLAAEQEEAEQRAAEQAKIEAEQAAKAAEEKRVADEKKAKEQEKAQSKAPKAQAPAKKKAEPKKSENAEPKAEPKAAKTEQEKPQDEIAKAVAERSEKEHAQKLKRDKENAEKAKAKKQAAVQKALGANEDETETAAKYSGKWTVCRVVTDGDNEDEMYFFELHASNGEKLLSSEEYTSYAGALRGIETHKANIEKGNFKITLSKKGDYIFKLLSGKNMLLCMGENYPTRARCESAIESTKRFAKTAVLDENVQDHLVKVPVEDEADVAPIVDNANGKWLISSHKGADGDDLFYFELFANNGEKLLSSEEYTTYIGAVNGIQTHKTNIEKNNFRISLTKRGDYIYKLLNGNGQLLCLGEHYKTKSRCQSAVESVQRFAANSPVLTDPNLTK